jgi:hypothetical protein
MLSLTWDVPKFEKPLSVLQEKNCISLLLLFVFNYEAKGICMYLLAILIPFLEK